MRKRTIKRWRSGLIILSILCIETVNAQQILTLNDCRRLVLENNGKMKNARLEMEGAKEGKREAFTKYFPNISAAGGVFTADRGMMELNLMPGMELSLIKNGLMGGVTAVQPIFAGGQIVNGNKLANLSVEVSRDQMKQTEDDVILTVEKYYWQGICLQEKLKSIEAAESFVGNLRKEIEVSVNAGVLTRNDLLRVKLKQNELASNRLRLENGLSLTKMVLAQYIGLDENDFQVGALLAQDIPSPESIRIAPEEALPTTASYRLLEKSVEAARIRQKIQVGQNLPNIGIGAGYMYHNLMDNDRPFGMIFATVTIPISDWWSGTHAIRKQKLQVKAAENSRQNTNELLLIGIRKHWNELNESYRQVRLAEESISTAQENLRLNADYYQAGTVTLSDLLDAQSLLQQSRDQYTDDYTTYRIKQTEYLQATGR